MKKLFAVLSIVLFLFAALTSCQQAKDKDEQTESTESMDTTSNEKMAQVQYTCTMHPEVLENESGKCPKCGMDLVKKEDGDMEGMDSTKQDH